MNIRIGFQKYILIVTAVLLAGAGSCLGAVLSVPQYKQEKSNWCWCAGAQMVLKFYGKSYSQTAIANWAVGGRNIANYLYGSTDANMRGDDEILKHFGNISSTGRASALSLSQTGTEIANSRPVMIRWGWDSGGGHILVIRGTSGNSVYINDPWYGQSVNSYSWTYRGGGHTWTHTLTMDESRNDEYAQKYNYYHNLALQYYNNARHYLDYAYAYHYYASAMYYYYMYYGNSSSANAYYNYYMKRAMAYANHYYNNWVDYYYNYYRYTGSYQALGYAYYAYAYAQYYYYLYYGNSSAANYYYNHWMQWAYYYYNL